MYRMYRMGETEGDNRVVRGGSWNNDNTDNFRCAYRNNNRPDNRNDNNGFRCASTLRFRARRGFDIRIGDAGVYARESRSLPGRPETDGRIASRTRAAGSRAGERRPGPNPPARQSRLRGQDGHGPGGRETGHVGGEQVRDAAGDQSSQKMRAVAAVLSNWSTKLASSRQLPASRAGWVLGAGRQHAGHLRFDRLAHTLSVRRWEARHGMAD